VDAGYYFVQRDAAWQAPCTTVTGVPVVATGAWGDNLAGDVKLKVGSPIRVELVLWDYENSLSAGQQGYKVIKLEPAELDRVSDYGHLADVNFSAIPRDDLGAIVHDPAATLRIERVSDGFVVFQGAAGAEINATGKIVYGYNLRVSEPGAYLITYKLPKVTLMGCDAGSCSGDTATLQITVGSGGGGGGGKGGGQGGGKPVKP
jgi:hypothetical protein